MCQPLSLPTSKFYHAHAVESLSGIMRRLRPLDFCQRDRAETFHESRITGIAEKGLHFDQYDGPFFEFGTGFDAHAVFTIV